jgi:hypothetical protein
MKAASEGRPMQIQVVQARAETGAEIACHFLNDPDREILRLIALENGWMPE